MLMMMTNDDDDDDQGHDGGGAVDLINIMSVPSMYGSCFCILPITCLL